MDLRDTPVSGDPGRTGMIRATRAEAVPSNPNRKQGPTRSGPSPHFPICIIGERKNTDQLTNLTVCVKAGDKFQIAVFGINGPISMAPANTVWFRQATMEFYK